jgi:hypothetical protein
MQINLGFCRIANMRQKLCCTDEFYQTAITMLLDLCTNSINQQQIVQLAGRLLLTVNSGDVFELVINQPEYDKLQNEVITGF